MIFSVLRNISLNGKLDIIDSNGKTHSFGAFTGLPSDNLYSKIRFTNKSIQQKLFINPSLYLGEGYMNKDIIIEEGTIDDFINIITYSYKDFVSRIASVTITLENGRIISVRSTGKKKDNYTNKRRKRYIK